MWPKVLLFKQYSKKAYWLPKIARRTIPGQSGARIKKQAEAEVVPSSSLVKIRVS